MTECYGVTVADEPTIHKGPGGIEFIINEDGSVSDARFVLQSGNPSFDYEALGAVECAGQPGHFGPLPDDLPFDRLPIRFNFRPGNNGIFR